jgi:hypothetical protein
LIRPPATVVSRNMSGACRNTIRGILFSYVLLLSSLCGAADAGDAPQYIGRHGSSPEDGKAIGKVVEDFRLAIKTKNPRLLSTLVLNSSILFDAPAPPDAIASVREKSDASFNGIRAGGYRDFATFLGTTKNEVEEKFYNVKITQDRNVAWVMFDYEFLINGRAQNYGVETWQMMKVEGGEWKILSVVWTMNRLPD